MRVEATATDEQDGMECRDPRPSPTTVSLSTSRIILRTYMTIISPTHTRVDDVSPPQPYILPTPGLFKKDWEMDILKRALQGGREHDFSGRSPGPYDGPPSKETTEDSMIDGDEDPSGNAEDVEDDDSGKRMPTNCINCSVVYTLLCRMLSQIENTHQTHQTNGDYLRFLPTLLRITDTRRTPSGPV
ncbi:hypothetical protein B0H14DRAFT_715727 [Mycena olivaceomarginata]|nr:hypothetical protein B0H14DRAFT_715727 [Mycena olivaceomarginata]